MYNMIKDTRAIGNKIGIPVPNIIVMKHILIMKEYLKWIKYIGPEYKSTYYWIVLQFVLSLEHGLQLVSLSLFNILIRKKIKISIKYQIMLKSIDRIIVFPISLYQPTVKSGYVPSFMWLNIGISD